MDTSRKGTRFLLFLFIFQCCSQIVQRAESSDFVCLEKGSLGVSNHSLFQTETIAQTRVCSFQFANKKRLIKQRWLVRTE